MNNPPLRLVESILIINLCLSFFFKFIYLIYLFLTELGLHCCTWAFSSCGERASHCGGFSCCGARALGMRASVVVARGLGSCGSRAQLLRGTWDLPGPGLEPVSPSLAGGFLTTAPPGKSSLSLFLTLYILERLTLYMTTNIFPQFFIFLLALRCFVVCNTKALGLTFLVVKFMYCFFYYF